MISFYQHLPHELVHALLTPQIYLVHVCLEGRENITGIPLS